VKELYEITIAEPPSGIDENRYLGLCHNDPCVNNIILGKQIFLIDYEFAGMGNIFFDIASVCGLWDKCMQTNFLKCYFGYSNDKYLKYLRYFTIVQLIWNATWGYVKSCSDNAIFVDYIGWANEQCRIALSI
jgi:thiamine kinase-like enzyme